MYYKGSNLIEDFLRKFGESVANLEECFGENFGTSGKF